METLSDKITTPYGADEKEYSYLFARDVKEFIKDLKEALGDYLRIGGKQTAEIYLIIKELAGKRLS